MARREMTPLEARVLAAVVAERREFYRPYSRKSHEAWMLARQKRDALTDKYVEERGRK